MARALHSISPPPEPFLDIHIRFQDRLAEAPSLQTPHSDHCLLMVLGLTQRTAALTTLSRGNHRNDSSVPRTKDNYEQNGI